MNKQGQKVVLLGITGGIAAYKSAYIASSLKKKGYDVHVLMTQNATQFIAPLTFETLTGNKACIDTFDRNFEFKTEHISLAQMADLVLIAPATANVLAKLANGIADDMLTTTVLACRCPKMASPAMNTAMLENPVTQDNLQKLRSYGWNIIDPACGYLACGDTGAGKMPEPEELVACVEQELAYPKDMTGLKVLVTAGPTCEAIDPVRYITNHSTGKMGYALARVAACRGAEVTLVSGPTAQKRLPFVHTVDITSAADMFREVSTRAAEQDIIIKAAAVADYRPADVASEKIKKKDGDSSISLERTTDILKWLGAHRTDGQFLCGFSMETTDLLANSTKKLESKNVDMIVANSLRNAGAGFGTDTNIVTMISREGIEELPLLSKEETAARILDSIIARRTRKQ
ncbi:MAG: bifunctional phosphopantothenoylcysteine decarboxylase/phosphopantothenate--cysteine ligase CoaBC [Eubacteriales bacterium]|nr:bifunctional phosphopantothenoylcysteine decarboxylase/phosphopantothenate--cysteine ligase CoaBC [Eubacteriales bacterium]